MLALRRDPTKLWAGAAQSPVPTLWWLDECPLRRVVTTVGINLAKNVFQLHGVNEFGKPVIKKQIRRDQMAEFFLNLPACLIGMEACGSAHHWARKLQGFGFFAGA